MLLRQISDPKLAQYAYLIGCQRTGEALLIDPERDVDRYIELARQEELRITAVAETHIHADFLSGARELAEQLGSTLYLSGEGGVDWQVEWATVGNYDVRVLHDGDSFEIGKIKLQALHTPGHTPEHLSFLITDLGSGASEPIGIATGDFVFVGDLGRPDLLESAAGMVGQRDPAARTLYRSIDRFLDLPDFVQVWPAHGAGSACGKALGAVPSSTVGYEKRHNAAIDAASRGEAAFVESILEGQPEPPLYFATMKRLNRSGPPLLGSLPEKQRLTTSELEEALAAPNTTLVDTRLDREAFMSGHVKGSLYAPLTRSFPTIVGSYVKPGTEIVMVAEEGSIEEAIRDLVRIGLDDVGKYVSPRDLEDPALTNRLGSTQVMDFEAMEQARRRTDVTVLDVRRATEHAEGHVPGSLNVAHTRLLARLDEVPKDGEILVYCRTGARAAAATALLESSGRQAVFVDDTFARWAEEEASASGSPS